MEQPKQQTPSTTIENTQEKPIVTDHSLSADLAMGWRPKLKVIGPIPLNFDNPSIDKSIKDLLKSQASIYQVIYLGPRPLNTFKMHESIKRKYKYKYQHLFSVEYGHLKAFFHKFYSEFQPKMKMPFLGMNPLFKSQKIVFDSCFQSGNLDCVVKVNQKQYDLILRIDSNTAGHIMWYYFRATNTDNSTQTVRFNIVNLRRNKSCYQRGMKPYIRRRKRIQNIQGTNTTIDGQQQWSQWQQGGIDVQVSDEKIRFAKQNFVFQNGVMALEQPAQLYRRLTFLTEFQPFEEVQFAYCVPYTYSDMLSDLKLIKSSSTCIKPLHLQITHQNQSLSGLQIPTIKITNKPQQKYDPQSQKLKFCVFLLGRQHPGESNGSYVMRQMLLQLVKDTPEMNFLRNHIVFRIIPMLNVDGVVMGNFRTSLYGKDLNRLFKKEQLFLIPEIQMCKDQFNSLQKVFKNKIMMFLDIHGHSARRNSFCYGPGILDANAFSDVREFAKIIASKTEIFRYPSCSFRIDQGKQTTARACFSKSVGLAYTIQSSNWSFYSKSQAKMIDFTRKEWEQIGFHIIDSLCDYAEDKIKKRNQRRKKKKNSKNGAKPKEQQKYEIPYEPFQRSSPNKLNRTRVQSTVKNQKQVQLRKTKNNDDNRSDHSYDASKQRTTKYQKKSDKNYKIDQIQQAENQSDKMSDNQMDSDSQGQDMEKSKFQKYMNGAKKMMIEFEKVYFGEEYEKKGRTAAKLRNQAKKLLKDNSNKNIKKNSQILACMRKPLPINPQPQLNKPIQLINRPKPQRKMPLINTLALHPRFLYPEAHNQDQIQSLMISQKVPFQKVILPKIEQSSNGLSELRKHSDHRRSSNRNQEKIDQWTNPNQTPQLAMIQPQDQYQNYDDQREFNRIREGVRQKSSTNYENLSEVGTFSPEGKTKNPFQTVQSKYIQNQSMARLFTESSSSTSQQQQQDGQPSIHNYQMLRQLQQSPARPTNKKSSRKYSSNDSQLSPSNIRLAKESLRYNIFQSKFQQLQPQSHYGHDPSELYNVQSITYRNNEDHEAQMKNIRMSLNSEANQHLFLVKQNGQKNRHDFQQKKKQELLDKLSDPISFAYGYGKNQVVSSQDLGGSRDKKNLVNLEFHHFNYSKQQHSDEDPNGVNKHHEKIQQIILNNLQIMRNNQKNNPRVKKQKVRQNKVDQKFSINVAPIAKQSNQISQKGKTDSIKKQTALQSQNTYQINKQINLQAHRQQVISSSVIFPRNANSQAHKTKTLQSQDPKKPPQNQQKRVKNPLSANRNFSQRDNNQFALLKQQQKINRKVMKFGGQSLPKINNQQKFKIKSPNQFSKTKININKAPINNQSPLKSQKLTKVNNGKQKIGNLKSDHESIQLICTSKEEFKNPKQQQDFQRKTLPRNQSPKHSNRQKLLQKLKQIQKDEKQKFGEHNLLLNKQLSQKQKSNIQRMTFNKSESINVKTNFYNSNQPVEQKATTKDMKIFSLPNYNQINLISTKPTSTYNK